MKKIVYIISFTFLGFLLQILVHAGIEIFYIYLLGKDFDKYGLGFSWDQLMSIHSIGSIVIVIVGISFGFWQGIYWWKRMYKKEE